MSNEREADRALKRQVKIVMAINLSLTKRQAANSHGICPELGRKAGRDEGSLFVLSQDPPYGLLLTLLTDSKVVNAFHSAMALLGNI